MCPFTTKDSIPSCQGPDPKPRQPRTIVPAGACDTHAHVFGPITRYPFIPNRSYTPPDAPLTKYKEILSMLGVERAVLVQPSVYGTDNTAMLDALASAGRNFRGVAVVDQCVSDQDLARMHEAGVRGVRGNLLNRGGISFNALQVLAPRLKELGWHIQLLMDVSEFPESRRQLAALPVDVVVDHMGHMPITKGLDHPGFQELLGLVREDRCWVKMSAPYRITSGTAVPYADVLPFARALVEANADRMLWATDWPHPAVSIPMPNDGDLVDLLAGWVPNDALRHRILVDNPAKLYGFL